MPDENHQTLEVIPEGEPILSPDQKSEMAPFEDLLDQVTAEHAERDATGEQPDRERDEKGKFKAKVGEESPPEPKKPEAEKPVDAAEKKETAPADEADPEVDGIAPPKGIHPKKMEGWNALAAKAKERGKMIRERDTELQTLRQAVEEAKKTTPLSDDERKELKRLQDYEFITDPEKSSKVTREFDAKMNAANESLFPLLSAIGVPATDANAKAFADANGGQPILSLEAIKKAGGVKSQPYAWWEKHVLNNADIDGRTRTKIAKTVNEYFDTADARAAALDQAPKDRDAWTKAQEEARTKSEAEYGNTLRAEVGKVQPTLGEWAIEKVVVPNATPEARAAAEAHNKALKEKYHPAFVSNLDISDPSKHVKVAMGIGSPVAMHWQGEAERLTKELEAANKRAKDAEESYSKVRGSSKLSSAKTAAPAKNGTNPYAGSFEESLAAAEAAAGGGR